MRVEKIDGTITNIRLPKWHKEVMTYKKFRFNMDMFKYKHEMDMPFNQTKYLTAKTLEDGVHLYIVTKTDHYAYFQRPSTYSAVEFAIFSKTGMVKSDDFNTYTQFPEGRRDGGVFFGGRADHKTHQKVFYGILWRCLPAYLYNDKGRVKKKDNTGELVHYLTSFLPKEDMDTELPEIPDIEKLVTRKALTSRTRTEVKNTISAYYAPPLTCAYIQNIDDDTATVRFFFRGKNVTETARIICKPNEPALFLTKVGDKFVECRDELTVNAFDFYIIGTDDFEGHFMERYAPFFGRGYVLFLALYCNAIENLVRMGIPPIMQRTGRMQERT